MLKTLCSSASNLGLRTGRYAQSEHVQDIGIWRTYQRAQIYNKLTHRQFADRMNQMFIC
jgi:hypothetical protein